MKFTNHHVAFTVINLEKIISFYEVLGFRTHHSYEDEHIKILHLKNEDNFIIELFEHKNQTEVQKRSAKTLKDDLAVSGIKHFALRVENLPEAYSYLKSHNINIETPITKGRTGINYFFVTDPEGNFVEIVEDKRKS